LEPRAPPEFWRPVISSIALSAPLGATQRSLSLRTQLALLLLCHLLLWTWVGWVSRSNFDTPGDMVEAYAWAQGWQWGYYKHPPLSAWVSGLWFAVVPESQLGYSLLSAFNGALGLAGLALLAREFLPRNWVLLTVAVASLAPGVTTLAMRFNANAILISTWPWAMALFVRLMKRGRAADAVLCGLACALAMLGKYYSGVMVLSLLVTALWLPDWRRRLFSAPMALAVLVFVIAMAPHVSWLLAQTHGPLQYAQAATGHESRGESIMRAFTFALAQVVFPLLAFLALRLALDGPARHRAFFQAISAPLRPRADQAALWLLAMLPILATMAATVLTGARTASVWGLAIAAGLALLASSRARDAGASVNLKKLWLTLLVIWSAIAVLAPVWWHSRAQLNTPSVAEPREELAHALHWTWRAEFGGPLPYISGTRALAASTAFYGNDHPRYWSMWNNSIETPWANAADVMSQGAMIVCEVADLPCQNLAQTWSADRRTMTVAKVARGFRFAPKDYVFYLVRPLTATRLP
jgi:4-amino-4-deoxy-L-arabinose transferase-like glycosyltransferase